MDTPDSLNRALHEGVASIDAEYLRRQRWFGAKSRAVAGVSCDDLVALTPDGLHLAIARIDYREGDADRYLLPLALQDPAQAGDLAAFTVADAGRRWAVVDATEDNAFAPALYRLIGEQVRLRGRAGEFHFGHNAALREAAARHPAEPARLIRREQGQSNSSIVYGSAFILKLFRRLEGGTNPDLEVLRFLTERTDFRNVPLLAGWIEYQPASGPTVSVGALQTFVPHQGGAWEEAVGGLEAFLRSAADSGLPPDRKALESLAGRTIEEARILGRVTGAMHRALASAPDDPDFAPEPITTGDTDAWRAAMLAEIGETRDIITSVRAGLPDEQRQAVEALFASEDSLAEVAAGVSELAGSGAVRIRQHGDYHLGQLLVADGDFIVLDFEGEPSRPLAARRAKHTPLKDVAGMLRSLSYAAAAGLFAAAGHESGRLAGLEPWADAWLDLARERFLGAYASELAKAPLGLLPTSRESTERALAALELEKALYELRYELNNRPDWLRVPLRGIERTLAR